MKHTPERLKQLLEEYENLETGGLRRQIEEHESAIVEAKKGLAIIYENFAKENLVGNDPKAWGEFMDKAWDHVIEHAHDDVESFVEKSDAINREIMLRLWDLEG
jgi:hypothetical protein